jgi:hypothetical protein
MIISLAYGFISVFYNIVACLVIKTPYPMDTFVERGDISAMFEHVAGRGVTRRTKIGPMSV